MSPTLLLALREFSQQARRDPVSAYDILAELTQLLAAPSRDPFAASAAVLAVGIMRAREEYAQRSDEIAEMLAEDEREPELPLGVAA